MCPCSRKESFVVYLGGQNLEVPETKRVTVVTRRSIIHPQFELLGLKHDVALIDLHSPVSISAWVGVVTLPMKDLEDVTYTDENVLLTAWGSRHVLWCYSQFSPWIAGLQDKVQYFFNTSLMSAEECSRVYDDRIQSNHICAVMAWNTDSCFSESGSPIVTQEEDASTLIGLLSFNDHCSEDPFHPGVASKDTNCPNIYPGTTYSTEPDWNIMKSSLRKWIISLISNISSSR
uniref:Peptidase S1 domain-containing protein n=1 Tax=Timema cristinae TaxID=61476 RepID=A0A7R9H3Y3_TIMCR|nr:unnamed protein product [Timema cristinae]